MAEFWTEKRVVVSPDADTLTASVARRFLERVTSRLSEGKKAHIALTGGVIGTEVLRAIGADPAREGVDWSRVHFWWGDERFVPRESDERNERGAREALLSRIAVPEANIHTIASSDDGLTMEEAAEAYAAELARFAKGDTAWPSFDVCFLGVGPDAHIASLFPDRPEIQVRDRAVVPVRNSPKPPSERITLTRPVLNSSKRVWMVVSGVDKAGALGLALAGASYDSVPAAGAKGRKRTILFVDQDAAAKVPEELIDQEY
ncbi:6-phosphogluconolactonase [Microbacterium telephonicum]|uniref:6-phosphogluconolactonase n=1 Tax=Microbacterium telephonicum TaxID=1714841 RepID=A0A498C2D4_9MICO|nr:6-phosphogluconolactonase [Microbacterium telephonicum]RLK49602.1 6-phosphogluconolactonase [Microbacterium telephonicum]